LEGEFRAVRTGNGANGNLATMWDFVVFESRGYPPFRDLVLQRCYKGP
jgi:hypothetical protein